jgi:hypothetical protein
MEIHLHGGSNILIGCDEKKRATQLLKTAGGKESQGRGPQAGGMDDLFRCAFLYMFKEFVHGCLKKEAP